MMVMMMTAFVIMAVAVLVLVLVLVLMRRLRCHLFVIRSEVRLRLGNVLEQFGQHAADVVIGGEIENLLTFTLGTDNPRRPQQTQVMTDERSRQSQRFRYCPHRAAALDARQHNAQTRGIAQQAKQVGERNNALIGCYKGGRQNRSTNN